MNVHEFLELLAVCRNQRVNVKADFITRNKFRSVKIVPQKNIYQKKSVSMSAISTGGHCINSNPSKVLKIIKMYFSVYIK